ncbi:MAG TPA: PAS domain-containing protein [Caulobacteraceae bacterium]|nr:PAS domain-containing protein [Caulobacteraceae bacterium]
MHLAEMKRLSALQRCGILDTPAEESFDRFVALAAELFDAPIALISLVDADRQWFKAKVGLDACSTDRKWAFCAHAIEGAASSVMVVENAAADKRFRDNPLVTGAPGIRFYAGAVLTTPDGANLGTLCVIDTKKRPTPKSAKLDALKHLAALVVNEIELRRSKLEIEEKHDLLALAEEVAGLGRWRMDLTTGKSVWSDAMYKIYGVDRETFTPGLKGVMGLCEPGQRDKIAAAVEQAVSARTGLNIEIRFRRPDGEERHVVARAVCRLDGQGTPIAMFGVLQDVTEFAKALYEAQAQAQRAAVAEQIGGLGHWRVDARTRQLTWSPQMYAIYGLKPDQPVDLQAVQQMIHDGDRDDRAQQLERLLTTGEPMTPEVIRIRRLDGEIRYVRTGGAAKYGPRGEIVAAIGTLVDITEQRLAQLALARSEASYRLLAENTSDMMLQYDTDGRVTYISPACRELTGYPPEAIIGKFWQDFIDPTMRDALVAQVRQQAADGVLHSPAPIRYAITRADGREIHLEGRPTLILDGKTGAVKGFNSMVRDVTASHEAGLALQRARADAEAATQAKAEFLANMSHELRTPLTAVLGFARLIHAQPELSDTTHVYLDRVLSGGEALLTTVNDILDFSKLEAGRVSIKPRPSDPAAVAREVAALFGLQAAQKDLDLEVGGLDGLPQWVRIDSDRVRQVLLNLMGNAMKFTDAGEVRLDLTYDAKQERLEGSVSDTGPGIEDDCAARLFDRFTQDEDSVHVRSGSGLGLAICKALIQAMGGEIGLESRPGEGSRFWFSIPAPICVAPQAAKKAALRAIPPGSRVLVADDNPANRALVSAMLGAYGAQITEAADGAEAVRLAQQSQFDMILMDLKMPNEDGISAARRLRGGQGPNRHTPILAFTADVTTDLPAGLFDDQVAKPVNAEALMTAAAQALDASPERLARSIA